MDGERKDDEGTVDEYAGQPEILRNLERFATSRGLAEHIRFGTEVTQAAWSDEDGRRLLRTSRGCGRASWSRRGDGWTGRPGRASRARTTSPEPRRTRRAGPRRWT
ncbi:hypothetical protein Shyhy01_02210 [Streptomyces hygroscopicus subsp. hygroscopicus]|nr:hypothetical protein Shyhy01_02210 [Streptomyces hygroscopicus subsp. hygroscopicus]